MKIYRLSIDAGNGIQAITDSPPKELLCKNLYSEYEYKTINSIRLNLDRGSKITDALSIGDLSLQGFPLRAKFCDIIQDFNLNKIQFVDIIDKDLKDYKFMFFNSDLTYQLDYEKSNFILIEDFLGDIEVLDNNIPKNREAVIKTYIDNFEPLSFIIPQNGYHFIEGFNIYEYDVFRIGQFDDSFYISERVKKALEANNITGVVFTEITLFNDILS